MLPFRTHNLKQTITILKEENLKKEEVVVEKNYWSMWVIEGAAAWPFIGLFNHTNISPPESKHISPLPQ